MPEDMLGNNKVLSKNWGLLGDIAQRLEGPKGPLILYAIKQAIREGFHPKPWATVPLGNGLKTADDFRAAKKMDREIMLLDAGADELMTNPAFYVAARPTRVDLIAMSGEDMGLPHGGYDYGCIFNRAKGLGLKLCPPEVGPQLWAIASKLLRGRKYVELMIAMQPIQISSPDSGDVVFLKIEKRRGVITLNTLSFGLSSPVSFGTSVVWVFILPPAIQSGQA